VNYTREPIIETVITPKEGCRLAVRNSKRGVDQEDYFVEAVEIVSFGKAFFFRSTERPKSFLLPVTDYEIIELKETKMILKSTGIEKSIKIGGGKEEEKHPPRRRKQLKKHHTPMIEAQPIVEKKGGAEDETQVSSSILRKLFPPPPNLIKEKFDHIKSPEKIDESISEEIIKEKSQEPLEENSLEKTKEEKQIEDLEKKEE